MKGCHSNKKKLPLPAFQYANREQQYCDESAANHRHYPGIAPPVERVRRFGRHQVPATVTSTIAAEIKSSSRSNNTRKLPSELLTEE